jgi:hypothetical protein
MSGNHWAAELTSYRPSEDAPDFVALVYDPTPGGRKNEDGTTSFSMRFPALILSEYVSEQQVAAQKIVDELNAYASNQAEIERLRTALETIREFAKATRPDPQANVPAILHLAETALSGSKDNV